MFSKKFHIIWLLLSLIHIWAVLKQFLDLLSTFDTSLLIQYGPIFFILLKGLVGNFLWLLCLEKKMFLIEKQTDATITWNIEHIDRSLTESSIKGFKAIVNTGVVLIFLAFIISAFLLMYTALYHGDKIYYAMHIFNAMEDKLFSNILRLIYVATLPLIFYTMVHNTYYLMYIMAIMKTEYSLFNDYLKTFAKPENTGQELNNEMYQNEIYEKLKIINHRQVLQKRLFRETNEAIKFPMICLVFLGICLLVSVAFSLLLRTEFNLLGMGFTYLASVMLVVLFIFIGQSLSDESEKTYNIALDFPWTDWNLKNRKAYLMFLVINKEPDIFRTENIFICQYEYLITVYRVTFSSVTFLNNVVSKNFN